MDTCEPGQALIGAAFSSAGHVPWASRSEFPDHGDPQKSQIQFPARPRRMNPGELVTPGDHARLLVVYNHLFASLDAHA